MIRCVAFDCFGTVFDMSGIRREEIADYVAHVKRDDFSQYDFPKAWWWLEPHPDAESGIKMLQNAGFVCVALSNGSVPLVRHSSARFGVRWDVIIDLAAHKIYKPRVGAYRTVEMATGIPPAETLMVTANPGFGDIEGAAAIGMPSQVIRHGRPETIVELAEMLILAKEDGK